MGAIVNRIDILLALVIVLAIAAMLGWVLLFRSGRSVRHQPARRTTAGESIVVAADGSEESSRAVELACRLAADKHAKVILTRVIEVPMRFALDASLPQLEDKAKRVLESSALRAKAREVEYEARIVKDRTTAGGLVQLALETQAGMVVVGFDGSLERGLSDLVVVSDLFRHTPCKILISREPVGLGQEALPMGRLIEPSPRS